MKLSSNVSYILLLLCIALATNSACNRKKNKEEVSATADNSKNEKNISFKPIEKPEEEALEIHPNMNFINGVHFQQIDTNLLPKNISYRGLAVVNDSTAWLSGSQGVVLRTLDTGKTWDTLRIQQELKSELRDIVAFNSEIAITSNIGSPGRIYKTLDGGLNWKVVYENLDSSVFIDAIEFWNDSVGLAFGDPVDDKLFILKTSDAGETWKRIENNKTPLAGFAASGTSIALAKNGMAWIATGGDKAAVFHSADYGQTWTEQSTPLPHGSPEKGIYSIAFTDNNNGIAVGSNYLQKEGDSVACITSNGGKTWELVDSEHPNGYRSCVTFDHQASPVAFTCGSGGTDASYDNGAFWYRINDLNLNVIEFSSNDFIAWAAGNKGRIYLVTYKL